MKGGRMRGGASTVRANMGAAPRQMKERPDNGRWFCGLLVGGRTELWRELRPQVLETFGVDLREHWETDKSKAVKPIPAGTEVVLVMTDLCGRDAGKAIADRARQAGASVALIGRKRAAWHNGLLASGLAEHPKWMTASSPDSTSPAPVAAVVRAVPRPTSWEPLPAPVLAVNVPVESAEEHAVDDDWQPEDAEQDLLDEEAPEPEASGPEPATREQKTPPASASSEPAYGPAAEKSSLLWQERHGAALAKVAESGVADGRAFVLAFHRETGSWRLPAGLQFRLATMVGLVKFEPRLLRSLAEYADAMTSAKRARLHAEERLLAREPLELPPEVLRETAIKLLGGVVGRSQTIDRKLCLDCGGYLMRSADVLAVRAEMTSRVAESPAFAQPQSLSEVARLPPPPRAKREPTIEQRPAVAPLFEAVARPSVEVSPEATMDDLIRVTTQLKIVQEAVALAADIAGKARADLVEANRVLAEEQARLAPAKTAFDDVLARVRR